MFIFLSCGVANNRGQFNCVDMDDVFETLISSYIENKVGISPKFISTKLADHLKQNLLTLQFKKLLVAAGTGNAEKLKHNAAVRSDVIYWLDKNHDNEFENQFFKQIELFIQYLNMQCYAGITDYEFHYSIYPIGSFYIKHLDQFKNDTSRMFSIISYLNSSWQEKDGGELLIHLEKNNKKILPIQGQTVMFKSNELPHEVLVTHKERMSITGWLKKS